MARRPSVLHRLLQHVRRGLPRGSLHPLLDDWLAYLKKRGLRDQLDTLSRQYPLDQLLESLTEIEADERRLGSLDRRVLADPDLRARVVRELYADAARQAHRLAHAPSRKALRHLGHRLGLDYLERLLAPEDDK
jgi:hypothetical protein